MTWKLGRERRQCCNTSTFRLRAWVRKWLSHFLVCFRWRRPWCFFSKSPTFPQQLWNQFGIKLRAMWKVCYQLKEESEVTLSQKINSSWLSMFWNLVVCGSLMLLFLHKTGYVWENCSLFRRGRGSDHVPYIYWGGSRRYWHEVSERKRTLLFATHLRTIRDRNHVPTRKSTLWKYDGGDTLL